MADTAAPVSPKKAAKKPSKPKAPSTHPPTSDMVVAAVKNLKDRKGSSLAAIKKYINANYTVDMTKLAPHVRKAVKNLVGNGKLNQVKGQGASGSFKLGAVAKVEKKPKAKKPATKKPTAKKAKSPSKAKKPAAKKPAAKKSPAKAKKPAAKKSPAKAKKPATKKPAKKPAAKKPAAKKSASKKPASKKPAAKKAGKA